MLSETLITELGEFCAGSDIPANKRAVLSKRLVSLKKRLNNEDVVPALERLNEALMQEATIMGGESIPEGDTSPKEEEIIAAEEAIKGAISELIATLN